MVGPNRPHDQFQLAQGRSWMDDGGRGCPDNHFNFRPERTWRCTLGGQLDLLGHDELTNLCAVLDTHCAEYTAAEGKGLKPPTLDEHRELKHKEGTSRLSHFTVHLNKRIGHIGCDLKILVGHLHHDVAKKTILRFLYFIP